MQQLLPSSPVIEGEVQFTPLRQALSGRMQRRIRRNRLSEEVNDFEHEQREMARLRKEIQAKDEEAKRLRAELEQSRSKSTSPRSTKAVDPETASIRINEIESELDQLRRSFQEFHDNPTNFEDEGIGAGSEQPWDDVPRGSSSGPRSEGGDTIQIYEDSIDPFSSTQQLSSNFAHQDAQDAAIMGLELESARRAKQSLLGSFSRRTTLDASELHFADSPGKPIAHAPSPMPKVSTDLYTALSKELKAADSRAEDAELALESVEGEIRVLCSAFCDGDSHAKLTSLANHFRSIRLEFENIMPGESALSLNDNASLLPEIVSKLKGVIAELSEKSTELQNMRAQERTLRGNFDHSLQALEKATAKVKTLEDDVDKMSGEMLEIRIRAKKAEDSRDEARQDNDKLRVAMESYRRDITQLESLIQTMEAEHRVALEDVRNETKSAREEMEARASAEKLGRQKAEESAVGRLKKIQELEEKLQDAKERAERVGQELEGNVEGLKRRVGSMSLALQTANEEASRLRKLLKKCEKKYRDEVYRGEELVAKTRADMIKAAAKVIEDGKAHGRKSKVAFANWELESDDVMTDEHGVPMTPSSVVRFADYSEVRDLGEQDGEDEEEEVEECEDDDHVPGSVEVARGKKKSVQLTPAAIRVTSKTVKGKRRYDSGIGINDSSDVEDIDDSGLVTPDLSSDGMEMDGGDPEVVGMAF